jgi:hypothetical protein
MQSRVDGGSEDALDFAAWKVNPEVKVPVSPFEFVTTTLTAPADDAGVMAVIRVELCTVAEVAAALPKITVAPARKPVPVRVTAVPPDVGPLAGETLLRVGGLTKVKAPLRLALWPLELVTVTFTAPAEAAGVVAVIWVELATVIAVAAALPKVTVSPARKPVPVRVTAVPPDVGPLAGEMLLRVGGLTKVKALLRLALWPLELVTVTFTAPAEPAGVVAIIWVELATVIAVAAALPKVTVSPAAKPVPLIVTAVPPDVGPLAGEMLLRVGGLTKVKAPLRLALRPLELVTVTLTAPAEPAGVVAVIWVELFTATEVAAFPPKVIFAPDWKPFPVMVT